MYTERTELQNKVVMAAHAKLESEPWFRYVCVDTLPKTDAEILALGEDEVVDELVDETIYWERM